MIPEAVVLAWLDSEANEFTSAFDKLEHAISKIGFSRLEISDGINDGCNRSIELP